MWHCYGRESSGLKKDPNVKRNSSFFKSINKTFPYTSRGERQTRDFPKTFELSIKCTSMQLAWILDIGLTAPIRTSKCPLWSFDSVIPAIAKSHLIIVFFLSVLSERDKNGRWRERQLFAHAYFFQSVMNHGSTGPALSSSMKIALELIAVEKKESRFCTDTRVTQTYCISLVPKDRRIGSIIFSHGKHQSLLPRSPNRFDLV